MHRWHFFGVSAVTLVVGALLATPSGAQDGQDSIQIDAGGQSPSISFCQERFYDEDDGLLRCNWAVNFNFACFISYPSDKVIQAGAKLSDPEVVGECDNGEKILKLRHY
ncbi:hypothetical protein [Microbulbifer celer]|uniref:Uncharacterized protein n=1 Tax=Microbulbifer celer TaxID=435905 RepID=A0ABW3U7D1_9GAMM|nr:hypothetical protein [Microbulbifer celer]UFN58616.1 hypothetical protein LPW13_06125 [Microbulbifer celer]